MFKEFSSKSTIHGIRYVGEKRRKIDKIFWITALLISFGYCMFFILDLWISWNKNVIITTNGPTFNIANIPYPAITICPNTKIVQDKSKIIYEKLHNFMRTSECLFSDTE